MGWQCSVSGGTSALWFLLYAIYMFLSHTAAAAAPPLLLLLLLLLLCPCRSEAANARQAEATAGGVLA
jgi:hypothetical protein